MRSQYMLNILFENLNILMTVECGNVVRLVEAVNLLLGREGFEQLFRNFSILAYSSRRS
jgi:hypothetical protein